MKSTAFFAHSIEQLTASLSSQIDNFRPTLGVVLAAPTFDLSDIQAAFDDLKIDLIGCTTSGEIANGQLEKNSISVLLMDINPADYQIFIEKNLEKEAHTGGGAIFEVGTKIRQSADTSFEFPAIIAFSSGIFNDGDAIVGGLKNSKKTGEIPIFGGMSGDNLVLQQTTVFTNQTKTTNGIAALVLDNEKLEVRGLATSGWQPLGSPMTITRAEGNVIYEINERPALDFFIDFFGYYEDARISEAPLSTMSAQYPLQIEKNGSWVMRSPIMGDENDRSVRVMAAVEKGDVFRFSISPGPEVVETTVDEFANFKTIVPKPDALLLFSCVGRHAALGPFIEDEIQGVYEHWEKPMIGFLTYGEFGNLKNGICEFHNETCSLVLIRSR